MRILKLVILLVPVLFSYNGCITCCDLGPNGPLIIGFVDTSYIGSRMGINSWERSSEFTCFLESDFYYYQNGNKQHLDSSSIIYWGDSTLYPGLVLKLEGLVHDRIVRPYTGISELAKGGLNLYIDWPDATTDTLYAEYEDRNDPERCQCWAPMVNLLWNGKPFVEDTRESNNGVFVF